MSTYEISKSSLLSLKAEILRKREELHKVQSQNDVKKSQPKKLLDVKNMGVEQRQQYDYNSEEENLLKKSRTVLESKAKLYQKLTKQRKFTDEELEHNQRFLVRFEKKVLNDLPPESSGDEMDYDKFAETDQGHYSDEYEPAKNPDEEWVEYTDCLGRTRKCMRKDLAFLKSKDADLRSSVSRHDGNEKQSPDSKNTEHDENVDNPNPQEFNEESELLSSDMRRELLRKQWEREERELQDKDSIHYQDILFSEARTHGVGYYGFSKDEEERAKQQEALKNLRDETQEQQKKAQKLRQLREKQLAARTKAARNRKRLRMGLPPEIEEPEVVQQPLINTEIDGTLETQNLNDQIKEKEKDAKRKKHIRPWDVGKEGIRQHYEHTQEEWVTKKRKERPGEFAPPTMYKRSFRGDSNNAEDSNLRESEERTLFFSTKKNQKGLNTKNENEPCPSNLKNNTNPYKTKEYYDYSQNRTKISESIINECEDFIEEPQLSDCKSVHTDRKILTSSDSDSDDSHRRRGIEVAPPPTFDYYGPSISKTRRKQGVKENLEDSIQAGLQYLRKQAEKKHSSTKHENDMFLL